MGRRGSIREFDGPLQEPKQDGRQRCDGSRRGWCSEMEGRDFTCDALMDPKFRVGLLLEPEQRDALTAVMAAVVGRLLQFLSSEQECAHRLEMERAAV